LHRLEPRNTEVKALLVQRLFGLLRLCFCISFSCSFLAGSPILQEALRQVGNPSFGRSHCVKTSQIATNRAKKIH
jgi:hypothetical protein